MRRLAFLPRTAAPATLLCVAAVAAGLAFPQAPDKGRKFALLVGVNTYDNRQLDDLEFAEADAKALADVLKAGGFDVRLLLGGAEGADRATRANVEAAVDAVLGRVTKRDLLVVALVGHGQQFRAKGEGGKE